MWNTFLPGRENIELYKHVAKFAIKLNDNNNIGLVVGATQSDKMQELKKITLNLPWLMPGVGFQGGNLKESIEIGLKNNSTPIINVSRGILMNRNGEIKDIREFCHSHNMKVRRYEKKRQYS